MSPAAAVGASVAVSDPSATGLHVFLACSPWVIALPAQPVERLLLPQDAWLDESPSPAAPAALGVLRAGASAYSAWDLGLLLGLSPQGEAWVLLHLPGAPGPLPLALRTGHCLSAAVLPASALHPLPPALDRERPGLFAGAFATDRLGHEGRRMGGIGLALELRRLWSVQETALAAAMLRELESDVA